VGSTGTSSEQRLRDIDPATMLRLLLHEAKVHAMPGREIRDLGDAIFLHDPRDPEPFWNRLEGIRWPADPTAFDQRLSETLVLFASLGRQPHVWPAPLHDAPTDLVARLLANGFRDLGAGCVMALVDDTRSRGVEASDYGPTVQLERLSALAAGARRAAVEAVVPVLIDAFTVDDDRARGVAAEAEASLANPLFMHYLARLDGEPAAVCRRATFEGITYLSSIGTATWARGRGLGELVTLAATADAVAMGSEWVHLGVFAENEVAMRLYRRAGFELVGEPAPDLLLVG
jgi:ribosomal protein S18 acetylase RimI-like enzyme